MQSDRDASSPDRRSSSYYGGSTGSSLAFVCAVKGYPLRIVTSDAFAPEKPTMMRAFGADLDVIPSPEGITPDLIPRMMERAAEIVEELGGFATDQFHTRTWSTATRSWGRSSRSSWPIGSTPSAPTSAPPAASSE